MSNSIYKNISKIQSLYSEGKLKFRKNVKSKTGRMALNGINNKNGKSIFFWGRNYKHAKSLYLWLRNKYINFLNENEIESKYHELIIFILDIENEGKSGKEILDTFQHNLEADLHPYEIAIPLHGLSIDENIMFKDIEIYSTHSFPFDRYLENNIDSSIIIENHLTNSESCIAVIKGRSSRSRVFTNANMKLNNVLSVMTFFNYELGGGIRGTNYVDVNGSEKLGEIKFYSLYGGNTSEVINQAFYSDLHITKGKYSDFAKSLRGRRVLSFLNKSKLSGLELRVLKSLNWYRRAVLTYENEIKFALLAISLETLLNPTFKQVKYKTPEQKRMRLERLAKLLEDTDIYTKFSHARYKLESKFLEKNKTELNLSLGWIRNEISHQGHDYVSSVDVKEMKQLYETALNTLLDKRKLSFEK
jgi:hypothetical protein